jgi:hypothetical protein
MSNCKNDVMFGKSTFRVHLRPIIIEK